MRYVWALPVALAACYSPSVNPGAPCGPNGECPSGLECHADRCVAPGTLDDASLDDAPGDGAELVNDAPDAAAGYVPWSAPVELTTLEPPTAGDSDPTFTLDRKTVIMVSNSPDDLYECTRTVLTDSFTCNAILALNSTSDDKSPEISAAGTTLYFSSNRSGSHKVYISTKANGVWSGPVLVPALATGGSDQDLAISPDGLTAVVVQNATANHFIFSTRASTGVPFSNPVTHGELEVTTDVSAPTITNGGAVIYLHAGGTRDIYVAYKKGNGTYTTPTPVTELNTVDRDAAPFVSADDKYMMFERAGDIFETTRP